MLHLHFDITHSRCAITYIRCAITHIRYADLQFGEPVLVNYVVDKGVHVENVNPDFVAEQEKSSCQCLSCWCVVKLSCG